MKILTMPQGSEAWFAARRGLPTASRFADIVTAVTGQPSKSQDKLINELIAESLLPDRNERRYVSADMEAAMKLEAEARCSYELGFADLPVREVGFILSACGRFGCSPDALVGDDGGAEIKCPIATTHIGYIRAGVLPDAYRTQVHGSMVVTGRAWWDFFSYHRGLEPFHLRVVRDAFTEALAEQLVKFCTRYDQVRIKFKLAPLGGNGS